MQVFQGGQEVLQKDVSGVVLLLLLLLGRCPRAMRMRRFQNGQDDKPRQGVRACSSIEQGLPHGVDPRGACRKGGLQLDAFLHMPKHAVQMLHHFQAHGKFRK